MQNIKINKDWKKKMKEQLNEILDNFEEIIKQLEDIRNCLIVQSKALLEEKQRIFQSSLNVQIRLLEISLKDSYTLHDKIDDTILDVIHHRLE